MQPCCMSSAAWWHDNIPMNAGCLKPITIITPEKSMLSPEYPAAVVAGNVEVSQAVTSCLFGALNAVAASQSTMNNFNFGNAKYQYYETICSGSGAGPGYDGTAGRTYPHDQHPADRPGNSRIPVSCRTGGFPHQARCRRPWQMVRRRRHQAHGAFSGRDGRFAADAATGVCRRSGWTAAPPARSAATPAAARMARLNSSKAAIRLRCFLATPLSSRHQPAADTARPE